MSTFRKTIPTTAPNLGRHVVHDDRSWNYRYPTEHLSLTSAVHIRHIPILDQGQVGSCTGNAGIGDLATDPCWMAISRPTGMRIKGVAERATAIRYSLDEAGAVSLYSDAETLDGDGPYPPNDNGSSGLSIAKVLKAAGLIAGYQHTFSLNDALLAMGSAPVMFGTSWYNGMFVPDPDGRVRIAGALAGGHEILGREIDVPGERVWFDNSWGADWGAQGRFYLTFTDFGTLLNRQGDIIVLLPLSTPAPAPTPPQPTPADADAALALAARPWAFQRHVGANARMATALRKWLYQTNRL